LHHGVDLGLYLHDTVIEFNFSDKFLMFIQANSIVIAITANAARALPVAVFAVAAIPAVWRRAHWARCRLR
jgi:hypothetical protein